jgi:hypothetical protein
MVWTVGIAIQNASALDSRFKGEFVLRDLLDSYAHAASLLHTIVDGRQAERKHDRPAASSIIMPAPRSRGRHHPPAPADTGKHGEKQGREPARGLQAKDNLSDSASQFMELVRHMASAATEVTKASICNIAVVIDSTECPGRSGGDSGAEHHTEGAARLNQLKCAVSSRPFAPMPSGGGDGTEEASNSDLMERLMQRRPSVTNEAEDEGKHNLGAVPGVGGLGRDEGDEWREGVPSDQGDQWRELVCCMRLDTSSLSAYNKRPTAIISLQIQEQHVEQHAEEEETHLLQDQPCTWLRTYSFYGKPWETAECLESTTRVRGIAGLAMRTRKPIRLVFAADNPAFDPFIDSKPGIGTGPLLSVPVADSLGRVRAVITLANRFSSATMRGSQGESAGSDDARGRLGFECFSLADELAVQVLAQGFVGSLVHHQQCSALSRLHLLVQQVAQQPSFLAAALALQDVLSSLCAATSGIFFITNLIRGECASVSGAGAEAAARSSGPGERAGASARDGEVRCQEGAFRDRAHAAGVGGEKWSMKTMIGKGLDMSMNLDTSMKLEMSDTSMKLDMSDKSIKNMPRTSFKTKIGNGLVGMCALRRCAVTCSGVTSGVGQRLDLHGGGRGEGGSGCNLEGEGAEEEGEELEEDERRYEEWEREMKGRGSSFMAIPFLAGRYVCARARHMKASWQACAQLSWLG